MNATPFELDILAQPGALHDIAVAGAPDGLISLARRPWDRIILTGMGSSHFAGIPTWRSLTAAGFTSWAVDTGQLLDTPGLLTPGTLLVATSQSGASGEIVELLDRIDSTGYRPGGVIGVTADPDSPLARNADLYLPLYSGPEATVSTKSYLNTLVAHAELVTAATGGDLSAVYAETHRVAETVEAVIRHTDTASIAARTLTPARPRLAAVGKRDDAATALFAALITKESSKIPIEGHIGGQFRHGPFELAGPGLTVFLYGVTRRHADDATMRLAADLRDTGADVVLVGDQHLDGIDTLRAPAGTDLEGLATGAVIAQLVAVELAHENGVEPGAFAYGSKITTAL
jgi:fructoselysine-6-P-deglycase FrlB-like protein